MSVATHLGIDLAEYDVRIRTFIPNYDEMLDVAAAVVPPKARDIVDLGTGTGALASRCMEKAPEARLTGIDLDPEILKAAARRLGDRATLVCATFSRAALPACDAVVASFSLHHLRTRSAKMALYRRIHEALRRGGVFVSVDCNPASTAALAHLQRHAWKQHLLQSYRKNEAEEFLTAWSAEDVYVPLDAEISLLENSGFRVETLWRKDAFAVLMGMR
jgi:trans-aconitate methyltransferase